MADSSPRGPGTVRPWQVGVTAGIVILLLAGAHLLLTNMQTGGDNSDYRQVAERFIKYNPIIARKLGKVISIRQIGFGGDSGSRSYNAFDIIGEERRGVCHIALIRAENGGWEVKEATLVYEGRVDTIPVNQSGPGKKGFHF